MSCNLIGDTANLIGALLTHQLPFQLYLGFYFVSIDICLLCQWIYYSKIKAQTSNHHDDYLIIPSSSSNEIISNKQQTEIFQHPAKSPLNIHTSNVIIDELTPFSSSASPSKWYTLDSSTEKKQASKFMAMLLFSTWFLVPSSDLSTMSTSASASASTLTLSQDNIVWLGRIFAWSCTSLYLMSRIPQLLKNRRRQSVEGLSASLFIFAVCGNLTYASSILSHPGQTIDSLLEALPYLIGSAGTLIFDFSIFCQFLYYKKRDISLDDDNKINQQV